MSPIGPISPSTREMVFGLRQMAVGNSPDDFPPRSFLLSVADRLERLERLKDHLLECEQLIRFDPGCKSEPARKELGL